MNEEPTLPKQVGERKPIANIRYVVWGLIAVIAMVMFIQLSRTKSEPSLGDKPTTKEKPQNAASEQVKNFQKQQEDQARRLQQEAQATRDSVAALNRQIQAFDQATTEAPGVPAPTEQQRRMIAAGVTAPPSPGQPVASPEKTAKQKAEEERVALAKSAQDSSTVAIDFSDSIGKSGAGAVTGKPEPGSGPVTKGEGPQGQEREEGPVTSTTKAEAGQPVEQPPQGRVFKLLEGTLLEGVLTNRITGSLAGPVNVMVTTPVYAHDHQTVLLPQGTRILGAVTKTGGNQDERLFVAFHRAILPTGYSVNLDQFLGLSQQGQSGLKDQVNRHYFAIFGASVALAAIEAGANAGGNSTGGSNTVRLQTGVGQGTAAGATHIIDQLLNRLPVFTVRERTRVKVYLSKDLSLGAYDPNYRLDPL